MRHTPTINYSGAAMAVRARVNLLENAARAATLESERRDVRATALTLLCALPVMAGAAMLALSLAH